ncbi:9833_t:CDS:2 [Acaulospora morrowiae]|uniref:9833_t:CDS:1 n=1 Tax=Acaulospora morrowiae TaxID=94023 RepID=A0A9N8YPL5_9GLOM|nr:9833_t:CDS:2 [Acaulospora morrowiae]
MTQTLKDFRPLHSSLKNDGGDSQHTNIAENENPNLARHVHFGPMPHSVKSWATSYSKSQKYQHGNFEKNRNQSHTFNELGGSGSDYNDHNEGCSNVRDDTTIIENERSPLIHRHKTTFGHFEDNGDYRSLIEHGKSTVKQTVFNAINILMGIAILALPLAFKHTGWIIGISIFLFCLISTNYTAKILKKCLDTDVDCLTYAELAHLAYGDRGKYFMGAVFMFDLLNASVALMILVGDSLKTLFPQVELTSLKLIVFVIITPLTWMPIHYLSYTSIFGIITASSLAAVVLIDGFTKCEAPGSLLNPMDTYLLPPNWITVPFAFGLINSAFSGHAVFPSLYRDMAKPCDYKQVVNYSYLVASVIYITVAISGYLMFGSQTMQEITQNIMATSGYSLLLNSILIWIIVINPISKFPLTVTPINISVEITLFRIPYMHEIFRSRFSKLLVIILSRSFVSFIIFCTAVIFPGFDRAMIFGRCLSKREIIWNLLLLAISTFMAILGTIWTFFPREWLE